MTFANTVAGSGGSGGGGNKGVCLSSGDSSSAMSLGLRHCCSKISLSSFLPRRRSIGDWRRISAPGKCLHSPTRRPQIANALILPGVDSILTSISYFEQVTAMDVTIVLNAMLLSLSPLSGPSASTATSGKVVLPKPPLVHPTLRCHRGSWGASSKTQGWTDGRLSIQ